MRHGYGNDAGQIIQNVSDTTGNILRTTTYVASIETTVMTKMVAKNAVKSSYYNEANQELKEEDEEEIPNNNFLLDADKASAHFIVKRLQKTASSRPSAAVPTTISIIRSV